MLTAPWEGTEGDVAVPALLKRAVSQHASRTALRSRTAQLRYGELDVAANRVALALLAHGATRGGVPGDRIAVLMRHDLPQIVALLAILKTGRIIVALNPTHPAERLRQLIDDADPITVMTDRSNASLALEVARDRDHVLRFEDCVDHVESHEPSVIVGPEQAAALVYTSGSTGLPKAVVQTHRQLAKDVALHTAAMAYGPADRIPLFASVSGGQGVTMLLCALLNGATLCPFPIGVTGLSGLADWMTELGINIYSSSASIFRNFMKTIDPNYVFHGVRAVRLSSEPATSDDFKLFQRHFPDDCMFVHTLSSSETANIAWSRRSRHDVVAEGRLPVGLPSRGEGEQVMLLDEAGQPVPRGEVGEITVKSRYVAAGYWRNDALTAERFGPDLDGHGTRLVRTGDLGRFNQEGLLEFIGRQDDRVKIRGNRITLSEIEAALRRLDGVESAAVEAMARPHDEPLLVGFVAPACGHTWSASALRRALGQALPAHMVPSRIVVLDALPLATSGKVDRDALRSLDRAPAPRAIDVPRTDVESFLADLWRESFNAPAISRYDDFFDLGGDSLIAAVMAARIHETFQIEIEIATFFDCPVLSDLALEIERSRRFANLTAIRQPDGTRPDRLPATYSQEAYWNLSQSRAASFTVSRCSRIAGPLDVAAFRRALDAMVARHEMLRTTFAQTAHGLVQIVHPAGPAALRFHDVVSAADAEGEAARIWKSEHTRLFDLTALPLARFALIRMQPEEYRFVYTAHAVLIDGLAWSVFFGDLARVYEQAVRQGGAEGLVDSIPPPQQPGDYAIWLRKELPHDGDRYREHLAWWANEILVASYPDHPRYRKALSWCMARMRSAPLPIKQVVGMSLRGVTGTPLPPRSKLPFQRAVPADDVDTEEGLIDWKLPSDVATRLRLLGRQAGTSYYVTRLAVYVAALAAETRDPNVVLYAALSNRNRPQARNVFGHCATLAILMFRCDSQWSFRHLLERIRDRLRTAQLHADLPYERIHREMRAWKIKMPQGRAVLGDLRVHTPIRCAGIEITSMPERMASAAPLAFEASFDADEQGSFSVLFDPKYYDPAKVHAFVARFAALLDVFSREPDKRLADAFASIAR